MNEDPTKRFDDSDDRLNQILVLIQALSADVQAVKADFQDMKAKARTVDELMKALKEALRTISAADARAWFDYCGYTLH